MAYKKYLNRNGKRVGPYYYESYRDENGKVKKRYLGTEDPDKKISPTKKIWKFWVFGVLALFLFLGAGFSCDALFNGGRVSESFVGVTNDLLFSSDGFTGLVVDDESGDESVGEPAEESQKKEKKVEDEKGEEKEEEKEEKKEKKGEGVSESVEESAQESVEESSVEEVVGDEEIVGDSDVTSVSEENETEVVGDEDEIIVEEINETVEEVNETVIPEINESIVNETVEEMINETLVNESIVNETVEEINESIISEINETIINETLINETLINETIIPGLNESIINETLINETLTNETLVNISQVNVSTLQYRAVINRPVKWLKKIDVSDKRNLTIKLPKNAENISVLTNEEVGEALAEIENYGDVVEGMDREEVVSGGLLTGNVALDIREGKGLFVRFWNWLVGFTISGNVILEEEISDEISDVENATIVELENIILDESEVGIEYYTEAPQANETNLSNGKRVVVSAPDELNYTEILAYAMVDNLKIKVNDSRLKLYWYASREDAAGLGYIEDIEEVSDETEIVELNESVNESGVVELDESEVVGNETDIIELNESGVVNEELAPQQVPSEEGNESENVSEELDNESFESVLTGNVVLDGEDIGNESEIVGNETEEVESFRIEVEYVAYDFDGDGFVDYVEWVVPHLSEQIYEIIYITKAEHLDSNYTYIEDVYDSVKALDGNYSLIDDGDYLRVTFEENLTNSKDITIYARAGCNNSILINGIDVPCEIYYEKLRLDYLRRELEDE